MKFTLLWLTVLLLAVAVLTPAPIESPRGSWLAPFGGGSGTADRPGRSADAEPSGVVGVALSDELVRPSAEGLNVSGVEAVEID